MPFPDKTAWKYAQRVSAALFYRKSLSIPPGTDELVRYRIQYDYSLTGSFTFCIYAPTRSCFCSTYWWGNFGVSYIIHYCPIECIEPHTCMTAMYLPDLRERRARAMVVEWNNACIASWKRAASVTGLDFHWKDTTCGNMSLCRCIGS